MCLAGHVHGFERTNRMFNYTVDNCGPIYFTVGDAGITLNTDLVDEPGVFWVQLYKFLRYK